MLCLTGVAALWVVSSAEHYGGSFTAVGVLNIAGTLVAMVSGYCDFWKGERLGIGLMAGALSIFTLILVMTSASPVALLPLGYVAFSAAILVVRYLMIRWYTFRPRG